MTTERNRFYVPKANSMHAEWCDVVANDWTLKTSPPTQPRRADTMSEKIAEKPKMVKYCKACRECHAVHCSDPVGCNMPVIPYEEAEAHHKSLRTA